MKQSEAVNEIATALGKAQREMVNPSFDKVNPHFKSKYASLASVRDSVVGSLSKNGIAVLQECIVVDGGVSCETRLIHTSGQWITSDPYRIPVDKGNAQGVASATTYARRISLQSFVVVAADDDDDGNTATQRPVEKPKPESPSRASLEQMARDDAKRINEAKTLEELRMAWALAYNLRTIYPSDLFYAIEALKNTMKDRLANPVGQSEPGEHEPAETAVTP